MGGERVSEFERQSDARDLMVLKFRRRDSFGAATEHLEPGVVLAHSRALHQAALQRKFSQVVLALDGQGDG